jgi:type I restriction enzyme, R subunit
VEGPVTIDEVMADVEALLDRSVATEAYVMPGPGDRTGYEEHEKIDLSQIDFELLRQKFSRHKRTKVEQLKAAVGKKLEEMVRLNPERIDFLEKFQEMIAEYNAGSKNVEMIFDELLAFTKKLSEEESGRRRGPHRGGAGRLRYPHAAAP